jgi:hypothetical protein
MKDGSQVEVVNLDDTEVAFDGGEVLVGRDDVGRVEFCGREAGADDVDAVEIGFCPDLLGGRVGSSKQCR